MLNTNHPQDDRLSALAWQDDDAEGDTSLATHVAACIRCTDVVTELGILRSSLAELPDLLPSRPLQLLPPVADTANAPMGTDGFATWVRRLFAPIATAGAALALVGVVGTAMPSLGGMAASGGAAPAEALRGDEAAASDTLTFEAAGGSAAAAGSPAAIPGVAESGTSDAAAPADVGQVREDDNDRMTAELPAERSPWPMVLFTGVALVVAAAVLRWIVVPRAG